MYPHSDTIGRTLRRTFGTMNGLPLTMLLAAFFAVTGAAAAPMGQACDPVSIVKAFNAAVSGQDLTGALALLDPDFQYVSGPGSALPTDRKKGEFPGQPPFQQVAESNIQLIDANTVEMDLTFSGGPIPVLPHPFMLHATFTVENCLITRLEDRLSAQTLQDLAALPPGAPGIMTNTGLGNTHGGALLLVLGLFCGLSGMIIRRTALQRR